MCDDNYRWGDDSRDLAALDAWLTREPDDEREYLCEDCQDTGEREGAPCPCGRDPAAKRVP